MSTNEYVVKVATDAVRRAASVCRAVRKQLATADAMMKKDKSPVTVADYASQAVVCAALARAFPNDAIVAEEGTGELRTEPMAALRSKVVEHAAAGMAQRVSETDVLSAIDRGGLSTGHEERFWTLDPIDGTKGFLRGEQYAVALALIEDGYVVMGVLGCPNLQHPSGAIGTLLIATRRYGVEMLALDNTGDQGMSILVDGIQQTRGARFCESVESGHSDQGASAKIAAALGITSEPVRMDSQAKYAAVARGDASIYLRLPTSENYRECIWDHAAGMICVEEAGGRVTDVTGAPLDFSAGKKLERNRGVIATSGRIHDAVVAAVRSAL